MKFLFLFLLAALTSLTFSPSRSFATISPNGDYISCQSNKSDELYGVKGPFYFTAEIENETEFSNYKFGAKSGKIGFSNHSTFAKKTAKYVKFNEADAFCNYVLTLPKGFTKTAETYMWVDAYCEGGWNSTAYMYCSVKDRP